MPTSTKLPNTCIIFSHNEITLGKSIMQAFNFFNFLVLICVPLENLSYKKGLESNVEMHF